MKHKVRRRVFNLQGSSNICERREGGKSLRLCIGQRTISAKPVRSSWAHCLLEESPVGRVACSSPPTILGHHRSSLTGNKQQVCPKVRRRVEAISELCSQNRFSPREGWAGCLQGHTLGKRFSPSALAFPSSPPVTLTLCPCQTHIFPPKPGYISPSASSVCSLPTQHSLREVVELSHSTHPVRVPCSIRRSLLPLRVSHFPSPRRFSVTFRIVFTEPSSASIAGFFPWVYKRWLSPPELNCPLILLTLWTVFTQPSFPGPQTSCEMFLYLRLPPLIPWPSLPPGQLKLLPRASVVEPRASPWASPPVPSCMSVSPHSPQCLFPRLLGRAALGPRPHRSRLLLLPLNVAPRFSLHHSWGDSTFSPFTFFTIFRISSPRSAVFPAPALIPSQTQIPKHSPCTS